MGKLFKGHKLTIHRLGSSGLFSRKQLKSVRKKLGLTSENKWVRRLRRQFMPGEVVAPSMPSSANNMYQYQGRTLSQLTGGV